MEGEFSVTIFTAVGHLHFFNWTNLGDLVGSPAIHKEMRDVEGPGHHVKLDPT